MKSGADLDFDRLMAHLSTGAGIGHTQIYEVWKAMVRRCHNPAYPRFNNYGGRGITVCIEWRCDFMKFNPTHHRHQNKCESRAWN